MRKLQDWENEVMQFLAFKVFSPLEMRKNNCFNARQSCTELTLQSYGYEAR